MKPSCQGILDSWLWESSSPFLNLCKFWTSLLILCLVSLPGSYLKLLNEKEKRWWAVMLQQEEWLKVFLAGCIYAVIFFVYDPAFIAGQHPPGWKKKYWVLQTSFSFSWGLFYLYQLTIKTWPGASPSGLQSLLPCLLLEFFSSSDPVFPAMMKEHPLAAIPLHPVLNFYYLKKKGRVLFFHW